MLVHSTEQSCSSLTIFIKQGGNLCHTAQNKLQVIDALATLLKDHGARVISKDNNVVQGKRGQVMSQLQRHIPPLRQLPAVAELQIQP